MHAFDDGEFQGRSKGSLSLPAKGLRLSMAIGVMSLGAVAIGTGLTTTPAVAQSSQSFEQQWEALRAEARREGQLVISLGTMPGFQPLLDRFSELSGVRVQTSTGSGSARATRILAEQNAGRFTVDVGLLSVAATTRRLYPADAIVDLPPLLIHPEVTDTSKWYGNRHWYVDPGDTQRIFVNAVRANNDWLFWYNTQHITDAEAATLQTPMDFLADRWKGRMTDQAWNDPGRTGQMLEVYFAPDAGPEWIRRYFQEMDIAFTGEPRLEETWFVRGRNPLKFGDGNIGVPLRRLAEQGLPIKEGSFPRAEGTLAARGSDCCIVVMKNAPNPNAAKLFLNWYLSQEGQTMLHKVDPSLVLGTLREDVDTHNAIQEVQRIPGRSYSFRDFDDHYNQNEDAARKFIVDAFERRTAR